MELCVWAEDREDSGDKLLDLAKFTKGDVIAYLPDGSNWGRSTVADPRWRIIHVPGITATECEALIARELPQSFRPNHVLRDRQMKIDLDALDALEGGIHLVARQSPKNASRHVDSVAQHANVKACLVLKAPITNSRLIG